MKLRIALTLLVGLSVGACSGVRSSDGEVGQAEADTLSGPEVSHGERGQTVGGATYDHHLSVHHGPYVQLAVWIGARERATEDPVPLNLAPRNAVELRLYRSAERRGEAAWTSVRRSVGGCTYDGAERGPMVRVPPAYQWPSPQNGDTMPPRPIRPEAANRVLRGEWVDSTSVACRYAVPHVLGDSLPAGWYFPTTVVRTRSGDITFSSPEVFLTADTLPPLGDRNTMESHLRYSAQARVMDQVEGWPPEAGPYLETGVSISNVGSRRVSLTHGSCPVRIQAHALHDTSQGPAWTGGAGACNDLEHTLFISPGETVTASTFRLLLPLHSILSDTLPKGDYRIVATARLAGYQRVQDERGGVNLYADTVVQIPAGAVRLFLPPAHR